ncbi:MAG: Shedu immune nuclease family protein [Planctomycetota bacterium]
MPKAKITTTSADSAVVEPFELRSGSTTRLVFKPLVVNNKADESKPVKGELVWQRRGQSQRDDEWEDESNFKLSQMTAGSGVKLELRTDELYLLTQIVRGLYGVFWKGGNRLPRNGDEFELADYAKAAKTLDALGNAADLLKLIAEDGFVSLVQLLARQENSSEVIQALTGLNLSELAEINSLAGIGLLKKALNTWQSNSANSDEEFWQKTLSEHSFVLSQVFSSPVVVIGEKAHVGGKNIQNKGGKQTDFLLKNSLTDHVLIIEIKTPSTDLLESKEYRQNVFAPSKELGGAITQIATYKQKLSKEFDSLRAETQDTTGEPIRLADPMCLIVIGSTTQLDTPPKRDSFELFRRGLSNTEIITFDELFGKVEVLLNLLQGQA